VYCPRCAAQNLDDAKFCRACGTNLKAVALALADEYPPTQKGVEKEQGERNWLERRSEAMGAMTKGAGLLGASLLIGVALGLFSNQPDWIIIWVGLAGWMACWGFISLTNGLHALMESRFMARQLQQAKEPLAQSSVDGEKLLMGAPATSKLSFPPSVTEHTTELLTNQPPGSKQAR
jgi:hypothetical protein